MSPVSYYVIIHDENRNELDYLQYAELSEMLEFLDEAKVEYTGNDATIHTIVDGEIVDTIIVNL
jgi:retron-type reverse transcriptase